MNLLNADGGAGTIDFYPFAYALFDECLTKHCWYCLDDERKHKRCTGCQQAFFCDKQCQSLGWKDHKFECRGLKANEGKPVPDIEVRLLGRIVTRHKAILCGLDKRDPDYYKDRSSRRNIMDIWAHTKRIEQDDYAMRKFEGIYDRLNRFYEPKALLNKQTIFELHCRDFINRHAISDRHYLREIGKGLYLDLCAYDHSCRPNTVYSCRSFIATLRPLNAQVNLLDRSTTFYSYIDLLCSKQDRRKLLKDTWYFNCECERCVDEGEHLLTAILCPNCQPSAPGRLCVFGQPDYKDPDTQLITCPKCTQTLSKEQVLEAISAMRFISDVLEKPEFEKMARKEAIQFLEDLLQKFGQLLPAVNVYLCKIVQALLPLVDQDDPRRLLELHLQAEECIRLCYPQNHPALAFHLRNIGIFAKCLGAREMALQYLGEAAEMFNTAMGPEHSLTSLTNELLEEAKGMEEPEDDGRRENRIDGISEEDEKESTEEVKKTAEEVKKRKKDDDDEEKKEEKDEKKDEKKEKKMKKNLDEKVEENEAKSNKKNRKNKENKKEETINEEEEKRGDTKKNGKKRRDNDDKKKKEVKRKDEDNKEENKKEKDEKKEEKDEEEEEKDEKREEKRKKSKKEKIKNKEDEKIIEKPEEKKADEDEKMEDRKPDEAKKEEKRKEDEKKEEGMQKEKEEKDDEEEAKMKKKSDRNKRKNKKDKKEEADKQEMDEEEENKKEERLEGKKNERKHEKKHDNIKMKEEKNEERNEEKNEERKEEKNDERKEEKNKERKEEKMEEKKQEKGEENRDEKRKQKKEEKKDEKKHDKIKMKDEKSDEMKEEKNEEEKEDKEKDEERKKKRKEGKKHEKKEEEKQNEKKEDNQKEDKVNKNIKGSGRNEEKCLLIPSLNLPEDEDTEEDKSIEALLDQALPCLKFEFNEEKQRSLGSPLLPVLPVHSEDLQDEPIKEEPKMALIVPTVNIGTEEVEEAEEKMNKEEEMKKEEAESSPEEPLFLQINSSRPGSALSAGSTGSTLSPLSASEGNGGNGGHSPGGGVKKRLQQKKVSPRARTPMYPKMKDNEGIVEEEEGKVGKKKTEEEMGTEQKDEFVAKKEEEMSTEELNRKEELMSEKEEEKQNEVKSRKEVIVQMEEPIKKEETNQKEELNQKDEKIQRKVMSRKEETNQKDERMKKKDVNSMEEEEMKDPITNNGEKDKVGIKTNEEKLEEMEAKDEGNKGRKEEKDKKEEQMRLDEAKPLAELEEKQEENDEKKLEEESEVKAEEDEEQSEDEVRRVHIIYMPRVSREEPEVKNGQDDDNDGWQEAKRKQRKGKSQQQQTQQQKAQKSNGKAAHHRQTQKH